MISKTIQYNIHWDKTQMLQNFPLCKKRYKNPLFFLSRDPTYQSFILKLWFLYELKHKVCLFKTVCRIFHFRFCFGFIKSLCFCSTICMDSLILKRHNSFQNFKKMEKPHTDMLPDLWFLSCKFFEFRKSKSWERQFFSVVTFK